MYEFWYAYIKPKYEEKAKLCYTDVNIVYIKTDDIYKNSEGNFETIFDSSKYELEEKSKKVIGLMKDELGGKIIVNIFGLRVKTDSYLIDDGGQEKKTKDTKKCVIKKYIFLKIIKTV